MKITGVTATPISHRVDDSRVRFGVGEVRKHDFVLVKITTDDGIVGWGESHHALAPTAVAELIGTSLRDLMLGMDPLLTEDHIGRVWRAQLQSHGLGTGVSIAYSGVDMALWDIRGKALGLPVCALLGASAKSFPAYAGGLALGFQKPLDLVAEVQALVESQGFRGVKLRAGESVEKDAHRIRAVRDALGNDLDIMIDVNTAYDLISIQALLPTLEECGVAWLEEPMRPDATQLFLRLRQRTGLPLAMGENHLGLAAFRALLDLNFVDVVQADASKAGGITELKKIGDLTSLHGLRFAPHCSHTPLNYAATLHVMSAVPNSWYFEAPVQSNGVVASIFSSTIRVSDGTVVTPSLPGLGVEVDESAVSSFAAIPGAAYVS